MWGKGCRGRAAGISTLDGDRFLPVTVPSRSRRGLDSARAGSRRPSYPRLGRGSATKNELNLRHQREGGHTSKERPASRARSARLVPHRTKAKEDTSEHMEKDHG